MPAKPLTQRVQAQAYSLVIWQLMGVIVLALLALVITGKTSGFSVLAGGLAYVLPNLVFVWRVFRYTGAQQTTLFVVAFFFGEMMKLILSSILVLLIVKYLPISLLSVLVGFIGAIVSFWIVSLWQFSRNDRSKEKGVA